MKKTIFFLSGLPRSGSTLLGSILGQNSKITVTPTSPLLDLMCYTNESFQRLNKTYTFDYKTVSDNIYKGILENFYNNINTEIVIDKHRGWPRNITPIKQYITDNPKIICTYRRISEIITSYIVLIEKDKSKSNFIDEALKESNQSITIENRAKILWYKFISDPYESTVFGLKNCRKNIHFVSYDELTSNPQSCFSKIYKFLNMEDYTHNFDDIINYCVEDKDYAWGVNGLHDIRTKLEKKSVDPINVLGPYLTNYYDQFNLLIDDFTF